MNPLTCRNREHFRVRGRCAVGLHRGFAMTRISITVEAFEAIIATLPLGNVSYERELNLAGRAPGLDRGGCRRPPDRHA